MRRERRPRNDFTEPSARDAARECCLVACVTEKGKALGRRERHEMRGRRLDAECNCCSRTLCKEFASAKNLGWPVNLRHHREGLSVYRSVFGQHAFIAGIIVHGGSPTERAHQTNS